MHVLFGWTHLVIVIAGGLCVGFARGEAPPEKLVATWNLQWFFDDPTGDNFQDLPKRLSASTRQDRDWKLSEVAGVIAEIKPLILVLQVVEIAAHSFEPKPQE
jgi:hypothetical protein